MINDFVIWYARSRKQVVQPHDEDGRGSTWKEKKKRREAKKEKPIAFQDPYNSRFEELRVVRC